MRPTVLALALIVCGGQAILPVHAGQAGLPALHIETKIHPSVYRAAATGRLGIPVRVYFQRDVAFDDARTAILAAGGALDDVLTIRYSPLRHLRATIPSQSLHALAADDRVVTIIGPRYLRVKSHNAASAQMSHVDELQAPPYALTGAGVAVSLFELAAASSSHIEFGGRMTLFGSGGSSFDQLHATHVAGTMGAAGIRLDAKGMAPSVKIDQYIVKLGFNGEPLYNEPKENDLAPRGVVADNNSWGFIIGWNLAAADYPVWEGTDAFFGAYDYDYTAPLDDISREQNVLFVHSSGNEAAGASLGTLGQHRHTDERLRPDLTSLYCYSQNGSGTDCPAPCSVGPPFCETVRHHQDILPFDTMNLNASGKNVVSVGAVNSFGEILNTSSRGPAKDGRVKPDVVARGSSLLSTFPGNSYGTLGGTSMSSPVVTGIAALAVEQWRRSFGKTPRAAELKAVIIAGAEDLGNPGPDYTYGFGFVDAKRSIDLIAAHDRDAGHIRTTPIVQGQQFELPLVARTAGNLRVVLHWADPAIYLPANQVSTAKALVNDLDLKVIDPSGTAHLPYVLDKVNYTANATRGVNTIDNVEVVEIANAAPGVYRVVVNGTNVPEGPQEAVIVSSARTARQCVDIQEPNDSSDAARNVYTGQSFNAGICSNGDVDYFKFPIVKDGAIAVDVKNTGDTPLRATLIVIGGETKVVDVPPYSDATISTVYTTGPLPVVPAGIVKFEATGALGVEPDYVFSVKYPVSYPPKRRAV
ncbi:MAG TPA: S8 family serine peptidase [Thermoanaerobaculia bacterium]|nr:S8 family serine peptidase [Thermoanaerobaculia bacterium]